MSLPSTSEPSAPDTRLYAVAVGVIVLGLYASQALVWDLARSLGLGAWANAVTALTMAGYSAGLLLLVPLIDVTNWNGVCATTFGFALLALLAHWLEPEPRTRPSADAACGANSRAC